MDQIETLLEPEMHRRRIELPDGRYLLFYTFETADSVIQPEQLREEETDN